MAAMRRKEHATGEFDLQLCIYCQAICSCFAIEDEGRLACHLEILAPFATLLMKIDFSEVTYPREGKHSHTMESDGLTCSLDESTALSAPILGQGNA